MEMQFATTIISMSNDLKISKIVKDSKLEKDSFLILVRGFLSKEEEEKKKRKKKVKEMKGRVSELQK